MNNLLDDALKEYSEYVNAYDNLAEKLEKLGASDEVFTELSSLCTMVFNINPDLVCIALNSKRKSLAI